MELFDPNDSVNTHLATFLKELKAENGLFYRYLHKDDFGKPKSTFLVCAFWYVEALIHKLLCLITMRHNPFADWLWFRMPS